MVPEINVYQCIVNISSKDFGVYFRRKAKVAVGHKAEQHGKSEKAICDASEVIMEAEWEVGGDGGWFWALLIFLDAGRWMGELRSLLGWLWRQWIFKLAAGRRKFAITLISAALRLCCARLLSKLHSGAGNQTPLEIG